MAIALARGVDRLGGDETLSISAHWEERHVKNPLAGGRGFGSGAQLPRRFPREGKRFAQSWSEYSLLENLGELPCARLEYMLGIGCMLASLCLKSQAFARFSNIFLLTPMGCVPYALGIPYVVVLSGGCHGAVQEGAGRNRGMAVDDLR